MAPVAERKFANGWTIQIVPFRLTESDCDGAYPIGWSYGVRILTERGSLIAREGVEGVSGPREKMVAWLNSFANEFLGECAAPKYRGSGPENTPIHIPA